MCRNCKQVSHDLHIIKNRACAASPGHKKKWTEPSSNRPIKLLSPDSKAVRIVKSSKDRKRLRKALSNFEETDVNLDNDQNHEMTQLVNRIEEGGMIWNASLKRQRNLTRATKILYSRCGSVILIWRKGNLFMRTNSKIVSSYYSRVFT